VIVAVKLNGWVRVCVCMDVCVRLYWCAGPPTHHHTHTTSAAMIPPLDTLHPILSTHTLHTHPPSPPLKKNIQPTIIQNNRALAKFVRDLFQLVHPSQTAVLVQSYFRTVRECRKTEQVGFCGVCRCVCVCVCVCV
jgi:hypothetical protein